MFRLAALLLIAFAMACSPVLMAGGGMAQAAPLAMLDDHCAGMDHSAPREQESPLKMSCAVACAALLAAQPAGLCDQFVLPRAPDRTGAARLLVGIHPEAQTPPPRVAAKG